MTGRQFIKLILLVLASFSGVLVIQYYSLGYASKVFDGVMITITYIFLASGAVSIALFSYVEIVMKDVGDLDDLPTDKLNIALDRLGALKKETLNNLLLIIIFFLLERLIWAISPYPNENTVLQFNLYDSIVISVRGSLFIIVCYALIQQLIGFKTASDFRSILTHVR